MRRGVLAVVSGFSGAGKGTLMKRLLENYDNYALSVSATTRMPREGELDGREYFFISREEFEKRISEGGFIEYASYVGNYYGTPKSYVMDRLSEGKDVILEIEIQGAVQVREHFPEAILIFVVPPDAKSLKDRLRGRGTESESQVEARLKRAAEEAGWMKQYDYIIVNDDIEEAARRLNSLIEAAHYRVSHNKERIELLESEMKKEYN